MCHSGRLLPADVMVMQCLQVHLLQMGGKYILMQVYCHFRRTACKTEASKKHFGMNSPKQNGFTVHLYEEQKTKDRGTLNFHLLFTANFKTNTLGEHRKRS
jgi:hypothetical protein